jgi:hypothetical protein
MRNNGLEIAGNLKIIKGDHVAVSLDCSFGDRFPHRYLIDIAQSMESSMLQIKRFEVDLIFDNLQQKSIRLLAFQVQ